MDAVPLAATRYSEISQHGQATGPLRRSPSNPRYFTDGSGKAIYLTGSHTWSNFQEKSDGPSPDFDYAGYVHLLQNENHNFMRLWDWEQSAWAWTTAKVQFHPLRYARTGPGVALDGGPRFDLTQFNQAYFDRLRSRVQAAGNDGIYVSVMLFQGWSVGKKPRYPGNPWKGHPFNRQNNINGIDGDQDGDGNGKEIQTLTSPATLALQERYVRKVVDTLSDLDNVLWEISNEGDPDSKEWQYHMIDYIRRYEAGKEKQHPIGMTAIYPGGRNADLFESPADWISPNDKPGDYEDNPPAGDGRKVIIVDTDHLWGVGGDRGWVWKSFVRGLNPIYMDPFDDPEWTAVSKFACRRAMGDSRAYANRVDLTSMTPHGELASSGYCLADLGQKYLIYIPFNAPQANLHRPFGRLRNPIRNFLWLFKRDVTIDLSNVPGTFLVEWFNPSRAEVVKGKPVEGGRTYHFEAPFRGDAVLYLRKSPGSAHET